MKKIRNKEKNTILYECNCKTMKQCLNTAIKNNVFLTDAYIVGENLSGSNFVGGFFEKCDLGKSIFDKSNMNRTKFSLSDVSHSTWINATLTNVSFEEIFGYGCDFIDVKMRDVNFDYGRFRGSNFKGSEISQHGGVIKEASFTKCNFTKTKFNNVIFKNVDFDEADFSKTKMRKIVFIGCSFNKTIFSNADVRNTIVDSKCSFRGNNFTQADLRKCIFIKTQFFDCDFSFANMQYFWEIETNILENILYKTKFTRNPKKGYSHEYGKVKSHEFYENLDFFSPNSKNFNTIRKYLLMHEREGLCVELESKYKNISEFEDEWINNSIKLDSIGENKKRNKERAAMKSTESYQYQREM